MIENKFLKLEPFKNCIRKVFNAILIIASIATNYSSKNQFKKWTKNLVNNNKNPKLAETYRATNNAIVKLCQAMRLATLSILINVQEITTHIKSIALETHCDVDILNKRHKKTILEIGNFRHTMFF